MLTHVTPRVREALLTQRNVNGFQGEVVEAVLGVPFAKWSPVFN